MPASRPAGEESFSYNTYGVVLAQICLGLTDFLPLGIRVLGHVHQLAEIFRCLLAIACAVGSTAGSPERTVAIGRLLERRLEFVQGSCWLDRKSVV